MQCYYRLRGLPCVRVLVEWTGHRQVARHRVCMYATDEEYSRHPEDARDGWEVVESGGGFGPELAFGVTAKLLKTGNRPGGGSG